MNKLLLTEFQALQWKWRVSFDYEGLIGICQNIVTGVDFRLRSWQHDSWLLFIHLNLTPGLDKANNFFSFAQGSVFFSLWKNPMKSITGPPRNTGTSLFNLI